MPPLISLAIFKINLNWIFNCWTLFLSKYTFYKTSNRSKHLNLTSKFEFDCLIISKTIKINLFDLKSFHVLDAGKQKLIRFYDKINYNFFFCERHYFILLCHYYVNMSCWNFFYYIFFQLEKLHRMVSCWYTIFWVIIKKCILLYLFFWNINNLEKKQHFQAVWRRTHIFI